MPQPLLPYSEKLRCFLQDSSETEKRLTGILLGMSYGSERGSTLIGEVIVGIVTAVVAIALFLDVAIEWKALAIAVLAVEGAAMIAIQLGLGRKLRDRVAAWRRSRSIQKHPEFIVQLYMLERRIFETLYDRSSSHPSLRLQGADAMAVLCADDNRLSVEFQDKVDILNGSIHRLHSNLEQARQGH